jgi:hypothetical protein
MQRRELMSRTLFFLAIAAVLVALVVFKVRVAVAGGKYLFALLAIIIVVWFLSRAKP